jgi:hypothetical protein
VCSRVQPRKVTIEKKDEINEYKKKGKDKKKSVPVSPALYHGIFMLKSNLDTSIELDTIKFRMRKVCKQKIRKRGLRDGSTWATT